MGLDPADAPNLLSGVCLADSHCPGSPRGPNPCSPVEEPPTTTVSTLTSVIASSRELFPRCVMAATMA
jgi:hypothetical protein